MKKNSDANDVLKGAVAGLIGGIAATVAMGGFQALLKSLSEEKKQSKKKEDEPANVKAAEAISENVFDHKLKKSEKEPAGEAMHWVMGAGSGLIYGVASELAPGSTAGYGLGFGAAVWIIADEIAVPALGLSKPITEFPISTHASALSAHLVYGVTADLVRRAVRKVL